MELYGSVAVARYTFDRWYLEMPEFWCKDAAFIKTHPYASNPDQGWGEINTDLFDFYKLNIEWMGFEKVFDLRSGNWRERLSSFVMWYGHGWSSLGGLWKDTSPLEHILFLGNYNVLATNGYRWVVLNHGPNKEGEFVELWYYISQTEGPDKHYDMTKIDNKEFL